MLLLTGFSLAILLLSGCTRLPESCPSSIPVGLSTEDEIAMDESLPFRFPLDESSVGDAVYFGWFGVFNWYDGRFPWNQPFRKYHAAEDYHRSGLLSAYALLASVILWTVIGSLWFIRRSKPGGINTRIGL